MAAIILYLMLAYPVSMFHYTSREGTMKELYGVMVAILYTGIVVGCIVIFILISPIVEYWRHRQVMRKLAQRDRTRMDSSEDVE